MSGPSGAREGAGGGAVVAEVRVMAFGLAPRGWAWCDGQVVPIAQNEPLYHLVGTAFGGDGTSTFPLPDARGRTPVHAGAPGPWASVAASASTSSARGSCPTTATRSWR